MQKTLLIVEDDAGIAEFLFQVISEETPHQAIVVNDGLQAMKVIREIVPDLFILNYQLPIMNGIELYDQLHAVGGLEHVPAIIISANVPQDKIKQRQIISIDKPFNLSEFLNVLDKLLACGQD